MSSTGSLFSQTLQEITNTKLDELAKKESAFEKHRQNLLTAVQGESDAVRMLSKLSGDLKALFSISTVNGRVERGTSAHPVLEIDLGNLDRFLAQARHDPSLSSNILHQWQQTLLRHVDAQALKYSYASLYGQLITEWLSTKRPSPIPSSEDVVMDDFEHVPGGKKMEARLLWERDVFEPSQLDVGLISQFLKDLFESTPDDSKHLIKALKSLRVKTKDFERELTSQRNFNDYTLAWTISGLVASDLLTDEKRGVLKDFMNNPVVLREIADVLNMRMAALETWSWGEEVQLEERRQLNGNFNIYMHEDLLQAIFLQYIGVKWSVFWKLALTQFRRTKGVWKTPRTAVPTIDKKRREYYLGIESDLPNVETKKQQLHGKNYFLSQLLNYENQEVSSAEGEEEANFEQVQSVQMQQQVQSKHTATRRAKQTARKGHSLFGSKAPRRAPAASPFKMQRVGEEYDDELDGLEDEDDVASNPMQTKQRLLHLLSTDIAIKSRLHGEITCFRSHFESLFPSLPHATITQVLGFLGVSQRWIDFFRCFLRAPLRFIDDKTAKPRTRKQGTPASHVLSEVFGEVVLFCLDFKINQDTDGQPLWRMHDDIWFWSSDHATCIKAWSNVTTFARIMGLSLSDARTGGARMKRKPQKTSNGLVPANVGAGFPNGQIRWGMLVLNAASGRFEIDQAMVDKHIDELSRQLKSQAGSVFAWIQTWNAYATKFFTSNFGRPANCYGRAHVDNMLATHERIQRQIFSSSAGAALPARGGSVVEFLKRTIDQRFGVADMPDGFFFWPTDLGGLEVQNPFIGLLQVRDALVADPAALLDTFEEAEKEAYRAAKKSFDSDVAGTPAGQPVNNIGYVPDEPHTFFSFEEYTRYREELGYGFDNELVDIYGSLLKEPEEEAIVCDDGGTVKAAANALGSQPGLVGISSNWFAMAPYWKWVAQLYGPEMIERFGGFNVVDPGLLPMGMVSLFRSGRVQWQE